MPIIYLLDTNLMKKRTYINLLTLIETHISEGINKQTSYLL